jgi:hypothetical protein
LKDEHSRLKEQISYYEEQHQAEKGRNSMIDFEVAIQELNLTLLEIEDEIGMVNKLIGGEQ